MTAAKGPYRIGALFIGLSAFFHLIAPLFAGFSADALNLFVAGLVYISVAYGLMHGLRWLAYLAFIVLMGGSIVAITGIWSLGPVPGWIYPAIVITDWMAVLALFAALWRSREPAAV